MKQSTEKEKEGMKKWYKSNREHHINRVKGLIGYVLGFILITFMVYILYITIPQTYNEIKQHGKYKDFCQERTNFCYCGWDNCYIKEDAKLNNHSKIVRRL